MGVREMQSDQPIRPVHRNEPASREDLQALRILSEVTTGVAEEHDPEALLGRSLGTMIRLSGAKAGMVRVVTTGGDRMRLVASQGMPEGVVARGNMASVDCGTCGEAIAAEAVRQTDDLSHCARRTGAPYFKQCGTMVVVPLQHMGRVYGVYTLLFAEHCALPEDVALLFRSISEHLGLALENARLLRENMRMTLMNERALMANEVHDSLAQTMAYMNIRLTMMHEALERNETAGALKYASDAQQALAGAYADLRELLSQFRSRMDPLGLVHALEELRAQFLDRTGVGLEFDNRLVDLNLSVEEEVQVFHIVQEALANVVRHSGARHARLIAEAADGEYRFTVEDDGLGFFALGARGPGGEEHSHLRHHLGINIMRERAQQLNGAIAIANVEGGGARVSLVFPADKSQRVRTG